MEQTKMNAIIAKQNKTGYNKSSLKSILFCGLMSLGMLGINTNNLMCAPTLQEIEEKEDKESMLLTCRDFYDSNKKEYSHEAIMRITEDTLKDLKKQGINITLRNLVNTIHAIKNYIRYYSLDDTGNQKSLEFNFKHAKELYNAINSDEILKGFSPESVLNLQSALVDPSNKRYISYGIDHKPILDELRKILTKFKKDFNEDGLTQIKRIIGSYSYEHRVYTEFFRKNIKTISVKDIEKEIEQYRGAIPLCVQNNINASALEYFLDLLNTRLKDANYTLTTTTQYLISKHQELKETYKDYGLNSNGIYITMNFVRMILRDLPHKSLTEAELSSKIKKDVEKTYSRR